MGLVVDLREGVVRGIGGDLVGTGLYVLGRYGERREWKY